MTTGTLAAANRVVIMAITQEEWLKLRFAGFKPNLKTGVGVRMEIMYVCSLMNAVPSFK